MKERLFGNYKMTDFYYDEFLTDQVFMPINFDNINIENYE